MNRFTARDLHKYRESVSQRVRILQDVGGRGVAGRPAVGGSLEAHHGLTIKKNGSIGGSICSYLQLLVDL